MAEQSSSEVKEKLLLGKWTLPGTSSLRQFVYVYDKWENLFVSQKRLCGKILQSFQVFLLCFFQGDRIPLGVQRHHCQHFWKRLEEHLYSIAKCEIVLWVLLDVSTFELHTAWFRANEQVHLLDRNLFTTDTFFYSMLTHHSICQVMYLVILDSGEHEMFFLPQCNTGYVSSQ